MEKPAWIKKQATSADFEVVEGKYDEYKDWFPDPKGYFLVRINSETKEIELAHCTKEHVITKVIKGKKAQELYTTAIKLNLVSRTDHAAYLGKELKKAELALAKGEPYEQE